MAEQPSTDHGTVVPAPFLVRVHLRDGRIRELPTAMPEQAQRTVVELDRRPEIAEVCWVAHPALELPVQLVGRYVAGIPGIGERQRVAHLFLLQPGVPIGAEDALTAWCDEPIRLDRLDILAPGRGMPCTWCLARLPNPEALALDPASRRGPSLLPQQPTPLPRRPLALSHRPHDAPDVPDPELVGRVLAGLRQLDTGEQARCVG